MRRSRELSTGRRWSVLWIVLTIFLLSTVINVALLFLVNMGFGFGNATSELIYNIASQLVGVVLLPVGVIAATLLYYDFRIRKEGFDLEMLNQALHADSTDADAPSLNSGF